VVTRAWSQFPQEDAVEDEGILPHRSSALLQQAWFALCDGSAIGVLEGFQKVSDAALGIREARVKALKGLKDSFEQQVRAESMGLWLTFLERETQ
jgi:hypothetical protein